MVEQPWRRLGTGGGEHSSTFIGSGGEKRRTTVTLTRTGIRVESGLDDLLILKTTDSAFTGFLKDAYTTLREADDRIFATALSAHWLYSDAPADWNQAHAQIRQAMLDVFAAHKSLAVQHTLHAMGEAALENCGSIEEITLHDAEQASSGV